MCDYLLQVYNLLVYVLFSYVVVLFVTFLVSLTADHWAIHVAVWLTGSYVAYVATEKYEECIFDKPANKVTLCNARFLEKAVFGFRRLSTWLWCMTVMLSVRKIVLQGSNFVNCVCVCVRVCCWYVCVC